MRRTFFLVHAEARQRARECVTAAPDGYSVTVQPPKRSLDQNAIFHALCGELKGVEWAGKSRDADDWKALLVSGHAVATKQGGEVVPGLEGEFVSIRESTASMDKARSSSLIEYTKAFIAQQKPQGD